MTLTGGPVEIRTADPAGREATFCLGEYFAELGRRFEHGYDPKVGLAVEVHELRPPAGVFLIATLDGEPIGCGGLRFHGDDPAEIKRMWVAESVRGHGIARRLLGELETYARNHGVRAVRLDTNRSLKEAIGLYRSAGYREIDAFNAEPYAHHWFEKRLR